MKKKIHETPFKEISCSDLKKSERIPGDICVEIFEEISGGIHEGTTRRIPERSFDK